MGRTESPVRDINRLFVRSARLLDSHQDVDKMRFCMLGGWQDVREVSDMLWIWETIYKDKGAGETH